MEKGRWEGGGGRPLVEGWLASQESRKEGALLLPTDQKVVLVSEGTVDVQLQCNTRSMVNKGHRGLIKACSILSVPK